MSEGISRRQFLVGAATLATTAGASRVFSAPEQPPARRKVLHLIGHSHIDAPFLWPLRDTRDSVLTTWQSSVDRMRETPEFHFSASAVQYYKWVERTDPRLFAEIQQRIQEGRWEVLGGWVVEPDCNIPGTESFIRHALMGKRYIADKLGAEVTVGFNPDSFGHARGLPTILAATGYKYYAYRRPNDNGENPGTPDRMAQPYPMLFWWEGPDGARILTWHISIRTLPDYRHSRYLGLEMARDVPEVFFPPGFDDGASLIGVGNHGGGVTKAALAKALALAKDPAVPVEIRFSTFREFFAALELSPAMKDLPVVRTDLEHAFRGCYSANGKVKWLNRRAERMLMTAETLSSIAHISLGADYPSAAFDQAWWETCFNQFHDTLAGSALNTAFPDSRDRYGVSGTAASDATVTAVESLARRVDNSRVKQGALFCFNPLPWPRTATVEVQLQGDVPTNLPQAGPHAGLLGSDGSVLPFQLRGNADPRSPDRMPNLPYNFSQKRDTLFRRHSARVELPACGYRMFEILGNVPQPGPAPASRIETGPLGGITAFAARDGAELLAQPIGFVVIDDPSNAWGCLMPPAFDKELGRPSWTASSLDSGSLRRIWTQMAQWRDSQITVELIETYGDEVLEINVFVDWREPGQILMLEIPTALSADTHVSKVAGGSIVRENSGGEEPGQDWVALEGMLHGETYAVALLNAQTYSYNCKGGRLRTVIVRSAPWTRDYEHNIYMDMGFSVRRFGLIGGKGNYLSLNPERRSLEFQTQVEYMLDSVHPGTEPWEKSFLEVSPPHVSVMAIKHVRDRDALVLRLQEASGAESRAIIRGPAAGWSHQVSIGPWAIVTVEISDPNSPGATLRVIDPLERS